MKSFFPLVLFFACLPFYFTAQDQKRSLVEKIFLDLPDTLFTNIPHSMFRENPLTKSDRILLLDSGSLSPGGSVRLETIDTVNLIRLGNGVYFTEIKVWQVSSSKVLVGIINTVSDFVEPAQSCRFYWIENKKYSLWKKALPICLPLNLFFTEKALLKDSIGANETFCAFHYKFSDERNVIITTLKDSYFEADYASDKRLTHLDMRRMRREKLYYRFVNGKFLRVEKK